MKVVLVILVSFVMGCTPQGDFSSKKESNTKLKEFLPSEFRVTSDLFEIQNPLNGERDPIVSVWQSDPGTWSADWNAPYLRVAVWEDGTIIFSRYPDEKSHDLMISRLSSETLQALKEDIVETGVFDRSENLFNFPDQEMWALRISFEDNHRVMYWGEFTSDPDNSGFTNDWWAINEIVLRSVPSNALPLHVFNHPPKSWREANSSSFAEKYPTNRGIE